VGKIGQLSFHSLVPSTEHPREFKLTPFELLHGGPPPLTEAGDKEVYRKGRGSRQTGYLGNTGLRRSQNSRGPLQLPLDKDQCAYCKEKGHWAKDCPKKETDTRSPKVLTLEDDD
jgi:hypothetical protein